MIENTKIPLNEIGTVYKAYSKYRIALIYPNSYHIGMSNLGMHTIYHELNSRQDTFCERVFFEQERKILSFETRRPLLEFDILAFSVSYEIDYLNVLKILKSSYIPIRNTERSSEFPLLIAGGVITHFNFKPLLRIVDVVVIGEGEFLIHRLMNEFKKFSPRLNRSRNNFLERLSKLKGFFIPYKSRKVISEEIDDINSIETCTRILTKFTEFSNTFLIELTRGCPFKCNFCVTAYMYKNVRFRDYRNILETAKKGLRFTKRIGLIGASLPNYPNINLLCNELKKIGAQISFSSLRVDFITEEILKTLVESGQGSITIAPESGNERLREILNKPIKDGKIIEVIKRAKNLGIKTIKLYFMIGLPGENIDDIISIIKLSNTISKILNPKLSISPFIPKPNTPFEKIPFEDIKMLKDKIKYIRSNLRNNILCSFESPRLARLEFLLSHGDEEVLFHFNT
ncbi:MAG: radical SAM protein [Candidatus Omnitrophica bacterium]|nr:radical SAM protein [Candidatus Omnitrophota bacterium]